MDFNTIMNEIVNDSVLDKIKKLLSLSKSNNAHEAELAMTKAQRLAAEYSVNLSLINIFEGSKKQKLIEKKDNIYLGNRKSISQRFVSSILRDHFNVKILYSGTRYGGMNLILIGTKESIDLAEYINSYLNQTFLSLWRDYYAKSNCALNVRNSYLSGLQQGLSSKLQNEQKQVETEKLATQTEETKNSFSLMVINEKERLDKAVGEFYPKLKKSYARYSGGSYSSSVISDGYKMGKNISIKKSIGTSTNYSQIGC